MIHTILGGLVLGGGFVAAVWIVRLWPARDRGRHRSGRVRYASFHRGPLTAGVGAPPAGTEVDDTVVLEAVPEQWSPGEFVSCPVCVRPQYAAVNGDGTYTCFTCNSTFSLQEPSHV